MDKSPQVNPITGDILATKASSQAYRDNWDRIFVKDDGQGDRIFNKNEDYDGKTLKSCLLRFEGREPLTSARQILLLNQAQCNNCFDIITSRSTHDYVSCSCGDLSVDGGTSYTKRNFGDKGYSELSVYADEDDIAKIREYFTWASYGPQGDQPKHYILLKDMSNGHINAILATQWHIKDSYIENIFKMELQYRRKKCPIQI